MKTQRRFTAILSLLILLLVAACGGTTAAGDATKGEELFNQTMIGDGPGCSTCHLLEPDTVKIGPSLYGVATRAETRVEGLDAEAYLRQSILEPNAYGVLGFPYNVMYQDFADQISEDELNDLVAYLLTLEE